LVWQELTIEGDIPSPRAGMSLCGIKNKLYLFGGSGPSASCYNDLLIFDPKTKKWQKTKYSDKDVVKARAGHSMTVVEEKIFIIGGSYGQMYYQDFYSFDTSTNYFLFKLFIRSCSRNRG
jgi:N-acetylneuraminic acid mutarotase